MLKAIIIDDEKLIREGLVSYIDWAELNVEICAVCPNGTEGIQSIITHTPHLILADICLPDISGLEMFQRIRSYGLDCEAIFISSYSEFQYAQQAVKLGAFDYLLKPLETGTLYECVKRCTKKILQKETSIAPEYNYKLCTKLLKDSLINTPRADLSLLEQVHRMGVPDRCIPMLLVSVHDGAAPADSNPGLLKLIQQTALAVFSADVSDHVHCSCIFPAPGKETQLLRQAESLLAPQTHSQLILCPAVPEVSLYTCLQETLAAIILSQNDAPCSRIYFHEHTRELDPDMIRQLDCSQLPAVLCQFISACRKNRWISNHHDFQFESFRLLEQLYKQLTYYYNGSLPESFDMHECIEQLQHPNNIYDLYLVLSEILHRTFLDLKHTAAQNPYTKKALAIIRTRYGENISLKSIAKELHISPSYLSSIFKEDVRCPFSDYLFNYRMSIAYDLVKSGQYRIYEIGEMVGYPNIAQFSKCFKKQFGFSPKQLK